MKIIFLRGNAREVFNGDKMTIKIIPLAFAPINIDATFTMHHQGSSS